MMGCETPVVQNDALRWSMAQTSFDAWRGRCLDSFTAVEAEVSEAVVRLMASRAVTTYPHLAGQRVGIILTASGELGERCAPGLVTALTRFQRHDALRTSLCHGRATVTLDRSGRWHAILRVLAFRQRTFDRTLVVIDEVEAEEWAETLVREGDKARQHLREWCVDEG